MDGREHFREIMEGKSRQSGFWHGKAHDDSVPGLDAYFGCHGDDELGRLLGDTVYWCHPGEHRVWKHPEGKPMFDVLGGKPRASLNQAGVFADATVADVERFDWPDPRYLDFSGSLAAIDRALADGMAVLSGMWSSFFHEAMDFFGMENYFMNLHTDPEVVEAVTGRLCDFYLQANQRFYDLAGDRIDALFFGNDFGSQLDMLMSPECFDRFVMPYFRKLTDQAKARGYRVVLHSCGSIWRVIPRLIDAGVDMLHPIQAKAANMEAARLSKEHGRHILFMGGLDTQEIMPFGTPRQVRDEVRRLRETFGPNFILSPSHECILPIVPPENVEAMAQAAHEPL